MTGIINRRLTLNHPGEIYVIVKLRGRIIAIVLANRINNLDEVELVASATLPDYVLFPGREGTVRGAGTAAVREQADIYNNGVPAYCTLKSFLNPRLASNRRSALILGPNIKLYRANNSP